MHRLLRGVIVSGALAAVTLGPTACGKPSTPAGPTLGSVDFRPRLTIAVEDHRLVFERGERESPDVGLDPPTVPSGTVVQVVNRAATDQRLQGGTVFDTGTMRPGETTTIVVTNTGATDTVIPIKDLDDPGVAATLTVRPRPTAG